MKNTCWPECWLPKTFWFGRLLVGCTVITKLQDINDSYNMLRWTLRRRRYFSCYKGQVPNIVYDRPLLEGHYEAGYIWRPQWIQLLFASSNGHLESSGLDRISYVERSTLQNLRDYWQWWIIHAIWRRENGPKSAKGYTKEMLALLLR